MTFGASPAPAADVISPASEAVAVTVYRDQPMSTAQLISLGDNDTHGLALIIETRTIDLPAGRSRLRFAGVTDGIIPQSAAVEGLPARIIERNFDYDLLSPGSLLARSVGQSVRVVRTDRKTGRRSEETAILRSGPDGVVLDVGGKIEALKCGGGAERLVFDHAPAGLSDKPTLSVEVNAPSAGRFTVRLSYLTVRLDWSADYVARINPDGETLDLTGWITLANRGAVGFANAPTEVVAGHLARRPVDLPSTPLRWVQPACWPGQTTHSGWTDPAMLQAVRRLREERGFLAQDEMANKVMPMMAFAAAPAAPPPPPVTQSNLGDYKLYTLAERTTVAARQTKQVRFLSQAAVKYETVYRIDSNPYQPPSGLTPARIVLKFDNKSAEGLGRPLPSGNISVRRAQTGDGPRELFAGEYPLDHDVPVGEPFEISTGSASDVAVKSTLVGDTPVNKHLTRRTYEFIAHNAKAKAVTLEIRQFRYGARGSKVLSETAPHAFKSGDPLWRLTLPAGGEQTLRYVVDMTQ